LFLEPDAIGHVFEQQNRADNRTGTRQAL